MAGKWWQGSGGREVVAGEWWQGSGGRGVVALGNSSPGGVMGFLAITLHQIRRLSVLVDGLLVILKERTFP
ncbi:MAG: hypothetical protein OSA98_24595 [Rubripirellula sp.]|nr:hypothetical protein [Rubripirellula sp.]